jgi:hypothetical protein
MTSAPLNSRGGRSCDDVDKSCGDDDGGRIGPAGRSPPELVWIPLSSIVAALARIPFIGGVIAVLEVTRTSEQWTFRMVAQVAGRVLRSPLIISPLLGSLFSTAGMPLPKAASNYLDLMAATVGPAAPD